MKKEKEKLIKKYLPMQPYDMAWLEEWLSGQAAQGLHLVKLTLNWAKFRPGPPQAEVRYALDVTGPADIDHERNDNYAQFGWEYVTTLVNMYYVYRTEDPEALPLHTDPVTQGGTLKALIRRGWRTIILSALMVALIMREDLFTFFTQPWAPIQFLILRTEPALLWSFLMILWLLAVLFVGVHRLAALYRLRRQLSSGIPLEAGRRWPRRVHPLVVDYGIFVVMVAVLLLHIWMTPLLTWGLSGPEEWTFPHVTLEEALEGSEATNFVPESVYEKLPRPNTFRRSLLCPEQYSWSQGGGASFPEGDRGLFTSVDYYRARSPEVAGLLTDILRKDIWKSLVDYRDNQADLYLGREVTLDGGFRALEHEGLDELYTTEYWTDEFPENYSARYYLGRKGEQVFRLVIRGIPDPEHCLGLLIEQFQ